MAPRRIVLVLVSAALAACKGGGGELPGDAGANNDGRGGRNGEIVREAGSGSGTGGDPEAGGPDIASCVVAPSAQPNAGTSGGPAGCAQASDCTVRFHGTNCCPTTPQTMTNVAAGLFDEARNDASQACQDACKTVRCARPPEAFATCDAGSCVLR